MNEHLELSEKEKAQQLFSKLCHDAGCLAHQVRRMTADLEDLHVKMHNAEIDYKKAKAAETPAHTQEATEPTGVTQ